MHGLSILLGYICVVAFSVFSATMVYIFMHFETYGFSPAPVISTFMLVGYVLFATPVQIFVNRKPKKFSRWHLVTYFIVSFAVCATLLVLLNSYRWYNLTEPMLYIFSFVLAFIYWFWDSVFLQRKPKTSS
ncbi:hypothetical protein HOO54_20205 [Bacillus sp. WMMC1349]|uniref:UPF0715 family protein n=1 Tax=Bacillus sp. WMMC1349 TaxID=2736254 RepID=UPI0015519366|nr:UPF0715 family protein [Bacillus sp. WMMC1349]NPC94484.1 hypothetical protein [Bacillus sp. WMMC1349]